MSYRENIKDYWSKGYNSPNVESHVFRVFGRVFEQDFGISGKDGQDVLDYGCGEGGACLYLNNKGFNAYGVDICGNNIEVCLDKLPHHRSRFKVISTDVDREDNWFNKNFDIIISIQVLYYLNPNHLSIRLESLYHQMKKGAYIYATMMGSQCWYYDYARKLDDGMYSVNLECSRFSLRDYRVNFIHSEDELRSVFSLFNPVHIGFYSAKYRSDEGQDFHYTFIGQKN